ncbi:sodium/hydrogen exchanger 6 [Tanacetum coccineum]
MNVRGNRTLLLLNVSCAMSQGSWSFRSSKLLMVFHYYIFRWVYLLSWSAKHNNSSPCSSAEAVLPGFKSNGFGFKRLCFCGFSNYLFFVTVIRDEAMGLSMVPLKFCCWWLWRMSILILNKIVNQRMQTDHFASAPDVVRLIVVESRLPNNLFQTWRPSYGGWKEAESAREKPAGGQGLGGSVMATSSKAHHLPILISATFSILIHLAPHITTVHLPATINNSQLTAKKLDIEKKNNYTFLVVNSFEATRELFRPISNTGQTAWQQRGTNDRCMPHAQAIHQPQSNGHEAMLSNNGSLSRYKACLVANRNYQQLGVDYDETFSPVVKPATIHTILSLAASQQCHVHHLDVKNAFLDSTLSEIVYMHHLLVFKILGIPITFVSYNNHYMALSKHLMPGFSVLRVMLPVSLAEALQYLTFTRPDLSYAIQQSWSSKRQYTVSRSSVEAEYRGVASVVAETSWLHNLLRELQSRLHSATIDPNPDLRILRFYDAAKQKRLESYIGSLSLHERVVSLRHELDEVQKALDKDPSSKLLRDEEAVYLKSFNEAVLDQERFLRQKAKVEWLHIGDSNYAYFHKMVKSRVCRDRIKVVKDLNNVLHEGPNVPHAFVDHYTNFLGVEGDTTPLDTHHLFLKKLISSKADHMIREVKNKEIKAAMFDIGNDKAAGPDGYTSVFFKKSWDIVGNDVCNAVRDFFSNGKLLQ